MILYLLKTSPRHWKPGPKFALLCLALISAWEYCTVLRLFKFTLKHKKKEKKRRISSKVCLTLKSSFMKKSLRFLWKLCRGNDWQARVGLICRTNAQSDHKPPWKRFSERCISPSNDYREKKILKKTAQNLWEWMSKQKITLKSICASHLHGRCSP